MMVKRNINYGENGIKIVRGTERTFGYAKDFKDLVKEKQNVISTVLDLVKDIDKNFKPDGGEVSCFRDGFKLTALPTGSDRPEIFKIEIDGRAFFLKKKSSREKGGFPEIVAANVAKKRVKNLLNVEVIQPQFAYSDKRDNHFVVSPWKESKSLLSYMHALLDKHTPEDDTKFDTLRQRVSEIENLLFDFGDVGTGNMFYEPSNDVIYLFDLHKLG